MSVITCDVCSKNFLTLRGLWNHTVKMHFENLSTLPKKPFPCQQCIKSFDSKQCLEKHVRKDHKTSLKLEEFKELQSQNKALVSMMEKIIGSIGNTTSVNTFTTSITTNTNKYFVSIDSRKMRDSISTETFLGILEHRREAVYKYSVYCHVNKDHPETASFKLTKDDNDIIHAERYDREEKNCNYLDLIDEVMRFRIEDIEYLLNKLPFDKDLTKKERTSAWWDQYVVRKHINELKTEPDMWVETRDAILFYIIEPMKLLYENN